MMRSPKREWRLANSTRVVIVFVALLAGAGCRGGLPPDVVRRSGVTVTELQPRAGQLALPKKIGSLRFAVIGDSGRGDRAQQDVADQMIAWRERFSFDFVVMLGDNIYDHHTPEDYRARFEIPYARLLASGVTFHAAIGNHDDPAQIYYDKFNMDGQRYYSFRRGEKNLQRLTEGGAEFFVLDSRSFDPDQLAWAREAMKKSDTRWKIAYFHHPLYTSGRYRAASRPLRSVVEPLLVEGNIDVVLSGHEHLYERVQPQRGIVYFTSGAAGGVRLNDLRRSEYLARGFDTDLSFMLMEVAGDELYFQAITRTGETIDAGKITKQ